MDERLVLAISGRMSSGKTTLARALHDRLGWPRVSFGDYVRSEAEDRGFADQPEVLQDLGARLLTERGSRDFCLAVLAHAGLTPHDAPMLIDGIRHVEVLDALQEMFFPVPVGLVHVDVSARDRSRRLRDEGVSTSRRAALDAHSTELQAETTLPERADIVISGHDVLAAAQQVYAWMATRKAP